MFCPACGTLNEDTSKFCGGCGYRLMEEVATAEEVTSVEEVASVEEVVIVEEVDSVEEVASVEEAAPLEETAPVYQAPVYQMPLRVEKPKDKGLVWGIISLVLGAGSLLCCSCPGGGLIAAVLAVILGCVGIVVSRRCGRVNGWAIAGLACGGVGILVGAVVLAMGLTMGAGMFVGMMETQPTTTYPYY